MLIFCGSLLIGMENAMCKNEIECVRKKVVYALAYSGSGQMAQMSTISLAICNIFVFGIR